MKKTRGFVLLSAVILISIMSVVLLNLLQLTRMAQRSFVQFKSQLIAQNAARIGFKTAFLQLKGEVSPLPNHPAHIQYHVQLLQKRGNESLFYLSSQATFHYAHSKIEGEYVVQSKHIKQVWRMM